MSGAPGKAPKKKPSIAYSNKILFHGFEFEASPIKAQARKAAAEEDDEPSRMDSVLKEIEKMPLAQDSKRHLSRSGFGLKPTISQPILESSVLGSGPQ